MGRIQRGQGSGHAVCNTHYYTKLLFQQLQANIVVLIRANIVKKLLRCALNKPFSHLYSNKELIDTSFIKIGQFRRNESTY